MSLIFLKNHKLLKQRNEQIYKFSPKFHLTLNNINFYNSTIIFDEPQ